MIDLREHAVPLRRFVESSLSTFLETNPALSIGHVALYSCPWSGWVSLCVDSRPHQDQNCPDFDHAEVAIYEAEDWSEEYESSDSPEIVGLDGIILKPDITEEGDEAFNRPFFDFLCGILRHVPPSGILSQQQRQPDVRAGVQLLDSAFTDSWTL